MSDGVLFLPRDRLQALIDRLRVDYRLVGPQVRDGAIVYDDLAYAEALPVGVRDAQEGGSYHLTRTDSARCFAWANGAQGLKPFLFSPREPLWRAQSTETGFEVEPLLPQSKPIAFLGARACDLAALAIQDRVFLGGPYVDPYYGARGRDLFLVAVNCTHAAATCFCASTGDGPRAGAGFDLALTELDEGFVVEVGSEAGRSVLAALDLDAASPAQRASAAAQVDAAAAGQTRALPGRNLRDALFARLDHPRWDEVATRCVACGNCTMVCPTCFCHAEHDRPALSGMESVHERVWDSCFTAGHGYIHGFQVRPEIKHRYRQWLTHKLGSWHEQFGRSGCVGCGRCIAWCPVGIDITAEACAMVLEAGDGD